MYENIIESRWRKTGGNVAKMWESIRDKGKSKRTALIVGRLMIASYFARKNTKRRTV